MKRRQPVSPLPYPLHHLLGFPFSNRITQVLLDISMQTTSPRLPPASPTPQTKTTKTSLILSDSLFPFSLFLSFYLHPSSTNHHSCISKTSTTLPTLSLFSSPFLPLLNPILSLAFIRKQDSHIRSLSFFVCFVLGNVRLSDTTRQHICCSFFFFFLSCETE